MDNETIKKAIEYRKAHLNLISYSLSKGYSITVHYGDPSEPECLKSKDYNEIKEASEACDEAYIVIYDNVRATVGWAYVVFGNDDNELVSDYGVNDFMETWWNNYQNMYEATE